MTEPYYRDDAVTLYHGDCLEIISAIPSGSARIVVTDPPYVIGAVSAGNINAKSGGWADMMNSALWFTAWYRECARILKHDGALWTFCNWRSLPVVMRGAIDAGLPVASALVWDKQWIGPGGPVGLRPSYEMCALIPMPGFSIEDRSIPDVWQHKVGSYKPNGHPAEKPVPLFRRIMEVSGVEPGDLVVDPFLGSGTAALAARDLGARFIGIEHERRWIDLARDRLAQDVLDFGGEAS